MWVCFSFLCPTVTLSITLLSLGRDCLFLWHKTVNFLLPFLPVCLLYSGSIMKLWTLLLHFFCLISQAPAYQRPIGHAHGFVSQWSQRLWLPWSESPSEWRPPFGKTLLFRTLAYFGGFDPSCAVLTADEMTSRWDEICVCYLTETCYRWTHIVTWLFENLVRVASFLSVIFLTVWKFQEAF